MFLTCYCRHAPASAMQRGHAAAAGRPCVVASTPKQGSRRSCRRGSRQNCLTISKQASQGRLLGYGVVCMHTSCCPRPAASIETTGKMEGPGKLGPCYTMAGWCSEHDPWLRKHPCAASATTPTHPTSALNYRGAGSSPAHCAGHCSGHTVSFCSHCRRCTASLRVTRRLLPSGASSTGASAALTRVT